MESKPRLGVFQLVAPVIREGDRRFVWHSLLLREAWVKSTFPHRLDLKLEK